MHIKDKNRLLYLNQMIINEKYHFTCEYYWYIQEYIIQILSIPKIPEKYLIS